MNTVNDVLRESDILKVNNMLEDIDEAFGTTKERCMQIAYRAIQEAGGDVSNTTISAVVQGIWNSQNTLNERILSIYFFGSTLGGAKAIQHISKHL